MITNAILALDMPHNDIFGYKTEDKEIVIIQELLQIDNMKKEPPSTAPLALINNFSYYIFSLHGFKEEPLRDWLVLPPEVWPIQTY